MKHGEMIKGILVLIFAALVVSGLGEGLYYIGWQSVPKWHDLGVVTSYSNHNALVWDDNRGYYVHNTWTTANITTVSHGIIYADSRDTCPWFIPCIAESVTAWHLNQTLGIEYKNGGWYEAQDP